MTQQIFNRLIPDRRVSVLFSVNSVLCSQLQLEMYLETSYIFVS